MGRRYANLVCKKADVDMNKRAGELSDDEVGILFFARIDLNTLFRCIVSFLLQVVVTSV